MSDVGRYHCVLGSMYLSDGELPCEPGTTLFVLETDYDACSQELQAKCAELAEAQDKILRIARGNFLQICSYCGWESPQPGDSWEALQQHVQQCEKHPATIRRAEAAALRAEVSRLRGALEIIANTDKVLPHITREQMRQHLIDTARAALAGGQT